MDSGGADYEMLRGYGTRTSTTPFFMDSSTGNIGIGKAASTTHTLTVSGAIQATHLLVCGTATASGVVIPRPAMTLVNSSSRTIDTSSTVTVLNSSSHGWNGSFEWASFVDSSNAATITWALATDASGCVFCVGESNGVARFYDTSLSAVITAPSRPGAFLAKYNPSGIPLWVSSLAGTVTSRARDVAVDSQGNALTVGTYGYHSSSGVSTLVIYNSSDEASATLLSASAVMVFVTKHSPSGALLWARAIDSKATTDPDYRVPQRVTVDASDNVLVTYTWENGAVGPPKLFNASAEQLFVWPDLSGTYTRSVNVLKLSPSGGFMWTAAVGNAAAGSQGLAVDLADGSVYVAGRRGSSVADVYNAAGNTGLPQLPAMSTSGGFLAKFSAAGTCTWRTAVATAYEGGNVCVDGSGFVYFASVYGPSGDLILRDSSDVARVILPYHESLHVYPATHNSAYCAFVAKHSPDTGMPLWAVTANSVLNVPALQAIDKDVLVASLYNRSFVMHNASRVQFWRTDIRTSDRTRGAVMRLSGSGTFMYLSIIGSNNNDARFGAWGVDWAAAAGGRDAVYVCGIRDMKDDNYAYYYNTSTEVRFVKQNTSGIGGYITKASEVWPREYTLPALSMAEAGVEKILYNEDAVHDASVALISASGSSHTSITANQATRLVWLGTSWHRCD